MNRIVAFLWNITRTSALVLALASTAAVHAQQQPAKRPPVPRLGVRVLTSTSATSATSATLGSSATVPSNSTSYLATALPLDSASEAQRLASEARMNAKADSALRARSGIDTIVTFAAQDSITYSVKGRKMRLRSQAYVKNEGQTLSAEIIELYFDQGYMRAANARDSAGRVIGVPKFADKGETYYGAELSYNFRTKRGTISLAETKLGEGFFFGEKVKRMDETTFYLKDGCYTSCDKVHPHFYFKSPRMKVIAQDRIFADPLIVYFSDIPVFAVPFGLFVENKTGRRSGILIPQVFFASAIGDANGRGIAFENLGYYWAINDTLDAQLTGSFYTKGSWLANFKGKYVFGRRFNGSLDLSYGVGGFSSNSLPTVNWRVGWQHSWDITPFTSVSGSINLSSAGYAQQTQLDARARATQLIGSQFSIRHTFDNGLPISLNFQRQQNVSTGAIDQGLTGGTSIQQVFPVRDLTRAFPALGALIPPDSWLTDIAFSYGVNAQASFNVAADSLPSETPSDRTIRRAQAQANPFTAVVRHTPSINISPKLGYFTIQPSVSYSENWYFRRIDERTAVYGTSGSVTTSDATVRGFFREYSVNTGVSLGTTLYGIANPRVLGINSLRHTLRPTIGFNYTPNFQNDNNLAGTYLDTSGSRARGDAGRRVVYSRYALDGGSTPSPLQANVTWSLDNNFEAKIQQDTAEKVVQLMRVAVNGSVNLAADSLKWSPISVGFSNTFADVIQFSGSANFSLYDQDTVRFGESRSLSQVNRFLWNTGKGLFRLTNLSFNLNYRLAGNTSSNKLQGGLQASGSAAPPDTTSPGEKQSADEAGMGARFQQRLDNSYDKVDVFGDNTPGNAPLGLDWSTDLNGTFSYAPSTIPQGPASIGAAITANLNLTLDKVWRFSTSFSMDLVSGQVLAPSLSLSRDLHCWDMSFRWQPFGSVPGYFFRLGIKSGQLHDVQLTRQDSPFYRR